MPEYNYSCEACEDRIMAELGLSRDEDGESALNADDTLNHTAFTTSHAMNPTPEELAEALVCPRCGSTKARRCYLGCNVTVYTRGYGYLDKAGCHRDMNVFKLDNDDPYGEYRVDGEVDHLKDKIRKQGTHQKKPIYSTPKGDGGRAMESAVRSAVSKPTAE